MSQNISMIRGTTKYFDITLRDAAGQGYTLASGETLVFGVKKEPEDYICTVLKTLTSADLAGGKYRLTLSPSDTEEMEPGNYFYDIGLISGSDYFSVVECSRFVLERNVTNRQVR